MFRMLFLAGTASLWCGLMAAALLEDVFSDVLLRLSPISPLSLDQMALVQQSALPSAKALSPLGQDPTNAIDYPLRHSAPAPLGLSSPISSRFVTSGFARKRYHPIYRRMLPHLGVDYGAPLGTPVMAVADGQISFVGRHALAGNMLKISHGPAKESRYLHLSGFSPRAQLGHQISAGEIIGYVGQSGLATGPHLHFEVWLDGKAVSPNAHQLQKLAQISTPLWKSYQRAVYRSLTTAQPIHLVHKGPHPNSPGEGGLFFAAARVRAPKLP